MKTIEERVDEITVIRKCAVFCCTDDACCPACTDEKIRIAAAMRELLNDVQNVFDGYKDQEDLYQLPNVTLSKVIYKFTTQPTTEENHEQD